MKNFLAYLDQNVLDQMIKGDWNKIRTTLSRPNIVPVYSYETLEEIRRSGSGADDFIELLKDIEARLIVVDKDGLEPKDSAQLYATNPEEEYSNYLRKRDPIPEFGYGLMGLLRKFFDGHSGRGQDQNLSFFEIFEAGSKEFEALLDDAIAGIDEVEELDLNQKELIKKQLSKLPNLLNESWKGVSTSLDSLDEPMVNSVRSMKGMDYNSLQTVQYPNVVEKILQIYESNLENTDGYDRDAIIGLKFRDYENKDRDKTTQEKIEALYFFINMLGYNHDKELHKKKKFTASFSDKSHAGIAAFCDLLFTGDKGLFIKANAVYEYLNVSTAIIYCNPQKPE